MHESLSSSDPDWAALARYLSDEATPGEADAIRHWIDASPDRPPMVDALRRVWAESAVPSQEWDVEAGLQRILTGRPGVVPIPSRRVSIWRWPARVALAAAAAAVLTVALTHWRSAVFSKGVGVTALVPREYRTSQGQYATIVLADGSRITLAPVSRLWVSQDFDVAARDVHLEGQALFKVAHNSARIFRVHTARGIATDIGTAFVVRAYAESPQVEVMVTEGRVALTAGARAQSPSSTATSLMLGPGDLGRVGAAGELTAEHGVGADPYTAWAEGRLVFHRTPLRDVSADLARWYGLDVRMDSVTADLRVTASFHDEPAQDVLRFVALSLGLRYELRGRTVVLTR